MHNIAVLRLVEGGLFCYPPGAPEAPRALAGDEALQWLRDSLASQRWSLCFAAPAAAVRLLEREVPPDEKKHLAQALPFMLEEEVAEDVDQLHFAYTPLQKPYYGVGICAREAMAEWRELLVPLPPVNHWLPEPLLLPRQQGEWCLLLEGDRAVLRTGDCEGLGCDRALLPAMLAAAVRAGMPEALVVYGDDQSADTDLLPAELAERAQWRRGDLGRALMLVAELPALNLRQGEFAPRLPLQRWWREWRLVAGVLAAVFCLQLLATWLDYRAMAAENLSLRAAREASYRQAYPQGAVVDPEKQLQRQLDSLRGTKRSGGFVGLVEQVGAVLQGESGTRLASINYSDRGGDLRMNIEARDYESVERIRAGINAGGLVATLESSSARDQGVRARLRVESR